MDVHGTVTEGFEAVGDAFARNFGDLGERGAAVAVYRDGRRVVDLWAGTRDVDGTEPWERGTAQVVRSATKGVTAAVPLLLHQRGELDLDAPVSAYWPEFKRHGKERITVRQVLNHRAGLPLLDRPLTPDEALDPARGIEAVAAQAPVWEPGTDHGYHALTYGWLVDGLVRRVTGRGTGEWIADEIARPLGLDLWIGLPADEERAGRAGRVGRLDDAPEPLSGGLRMRPKRSVTAAYDDPASLTRRAFGSVSPAGDQNDPAYRAAPMPAANGIATADGLARFYAALIGEVDGVRLFDPATVAAARAEESAGPDRVLVVATRFGLGYMLHGGASPLLSPGSFGHPGRGGSLGFADPETGIALGYVTNGFRRTVTADPRAQALVRAVRVSLDAG
ncbi:serine hydrolase domain-containing protein [Streptomyces sp. CRN 30]|uniref:serine hydrolase domain-containing protein n=1 Tax=Streptomyces sp. CRN 30 TaxID=3075613 RepID=UPI002A80EC60|nr:serine hydrolase domain-containing protein [Streptomyces sp. CRN 30]